MDKWIDELRYYLCIVRISDHYLSNTRTHIKNNSSSKKYLSNFKRNRTTIKEENPKFSRSQVKKKYKYMFHHHPLLNLNLNLNPNPSLSPTHSHSRNNQTVVAALIVGKMISKFAPTVCLHFAKTALNIHPI